MRIYFVKIGKRWINIGGGNVVWIADNGVEGHCQVKLASGDVVSSRMSSTDLMALLERESAALARNFQ